MTVVDVVEVQRSAVLQMLKDVSIREATHDVVWKILIYDLTGQQILAPLVSVGTLRANGVTLNLRLEENRSSVNDAAAVYFVEPTEPNLQQIVKDVTSQLYRSFHIQFVSAITDDELRRFAHKVATTAAKPRLIQSVVDRYLRFSSIAPNLISLMEPNCFKSFYGNELEETVEAKLNQVSQAMISVIRTCDVCPCLLWPHTANAASEVVVKRVSALLRTQTADLGVEAANFVFVDRSFDFSSTLMHPWSYRALVHDEFKISTNRITLPPDANSVAKQSYVLDDAIWKQFANSTIAEVAEGVPDLLKKYNARISKLNAVGKNGEEEMALQRMAQSATAVMSEKKALDAHTNIATRLIERIKNRQLDQFVDLEATLLSTTAFLSSTSTLLNRVEQMILHSSGNYEDKLRLLICFVLATPPAASDTPAFEQICQQLQAQNIDASQTSKVPLEVLAVKRMRAMSQLSSKPPEAPPGASEGGSASSGSLTEANRHLLSSAAAVWNSSLIDKSRSIVAQGVQQLGVSSLKREFPLIGSLRSLLRGAAGNGSDMSSSVPFSAKFDVDESFCRFSPNAPLYVILLGGGSYAEAAAVEEFAKRSNRNMQLFEGGAFPRTVSSYSWAEVDDGGDDEFDVMNDDPSKYDLSPVTTMSSRDRDDDNDDDCTYLLSQHKLWTKDATFLPNTTLDEAHGLLDTYLACPVLQKIVTSHRIDSSERRSFNTNTSTQTSFGFVYLYVHGNGVFVDFAFAGGDGLIHAVACRVVRALLLQEEATTVGKEGQLTTDSQLGYWVSRLLIHFNPVCF